MDGRAGLRAEGYDALRAAGFDALVAPTLIVSATANARLLHANPAAARVLDLDADVAGRPIAEALTFDLAPLLDRLLDGESVEDERIVIDSQDGPTHWAVSLAPLLDEEDGTVDAAVVTFVDVTGHALERNAERAVLHDLATGMAGDPRVGDVYERVVASAARTTNGRCAALYLSEDGRTFTLAAATDGLTPPESFEVAEASSAAWQTLLGQAGIAWPGEAGELSLPLAGEPGWTSGLAAGFGGGGSRRGLLCVGEPADDGYADGALERLEIAASLAGTALANAKLVEEQRALEQLLSGAVQTTARLIAADVPGQVQQRLLEGLVGSMGLTGAALWSPQDDDEREPGSLALVGSAGLPESVGEAVAWLPPSSVAARLVSGSEEADGAAVVAASSWPGHPVHFVVLPPPVGGLLGVYADRRLPPLVHEVLATLGHAVAAAERQTTLRQRARTVVDSLQRELRPTAVDLPEGVGVGWIYRSATSGVEVGGDFYDVFSTSSGHIGLACGDVSGKGVEAASLTAMAVHTLRAYALQGAASHVVLSLLNGAVCKQTTVERFMTLAYARVDPVDWSVCFTLAGHPPPLVVGPEGARVVDVEPDVPAGVDDSSAFHEHLLELAPGEALVLVTDGVTEARRDGDDADADSLLGIEGLVAALDEQSGLSAQSIADRAWGAVEDWTGGGTTDDCAVLVFRRDPD